MQHYIDGFVFPIARDRIDDYLPVARAVAEIYREYGAIDYQEFLGDDMNRMGTRTFPDAINSSPGETVVFGWITFPSRAVRDKANERVESDPRIAELVAPLLDPANPVFDPTRMAYGGFRPLVRAVDQDFG